MTSTKENRIKIESYWKYIFRQKFKYIASEVSLFADFGVNPESRRIGAIDPRR
jgi:hypothetical protein